MEKELLYLLNKQIYSIIEALEIAESDEAKETLEAVLEDLKLKADTLHPVMVETIAELDAQEEKYSKEIARLQDRKKSVQKHRDNVKKVLFDWVKSKGGKVELDTKKLSIRKNPESIEIQNEQLIIDKLPVTEIKYSISKTKLKDFLIDGKVIVDGEIVAMTKQSESLVIK
jgi:hypothetical protein